MTTHLGWLRRLRPGTWWRYLRAVRRARQGRITDHPLQAPGFTIVDTTRTVVFLHRGRTLGDYPPIDHIVAAARSVAAGRIKAPALRTGATVNR